MFNFHEHAVVIKWSGGTTSKELSNNRLWLFIEVDVIYNKSWIIDY